MRPRQWISYEIYAGKSAKVEDPKAPLEFQSGQIFCLCLCKKQIFCFRRIPNDRKSGHFEPDLRNRRFRVKGDLFLLTTQRLKAQDELRVKKVGTS
jgi:hypothetical protein